MRLRLLALLAVGSFLVQYIVMILSISALLAIGSKDSFAATLEDMVQGCVMGTNGSHGPLVTSAACLFLSLTQAAFLVPTCAPMVQGSGQRSLRWTTISASAIVAVFTAIWLLALTTTIHLYFPTAQFAGQESIFFVALLGAFVVSWIYWGKAFQLAAEHSPEPERLLLRRVFGATGLLIVATIPLDVMARRKTDCYCASGTLWSLMWGIAGGVWLLGPWAVRGRTRAMRHQLSGAYCMRCGHARGSIAIVTCPECGQTYRLVSPSSPPRTGD